MVNSDYIKTLARHIGFDLCGITACKNFEINKQAYISWLEHGYDSTLGYMRNHLNKRFDVRHLVDGAQTVVVCAVAYKSDISGGYSLSDNSKIASYACNRDYHKTIKKMFRELLSELQSTYPQLRGRAFVDSAPVLEKQYAVEAGLGWIGKQSLLITPEFGSYVLLGELVIDDVVDCYDAPYSGVGCGECQRCIDACPTSAIIAPMTINTAHCISCHTIESHTECDMDLYGWIFGCDECQNCCPYNKRAMKYRNQHFKPLFDPREISKEEWCAMSESQFQERFGLTPLKRSGLEHIKHNIDKKKLSGS